MSAYSHREARRRTFDKVADLYATARRPYPDEVAADLVRLAGLTRDSAVVEIGCGTGQATLPLAARGLRITCIELGSRLAEIARRNLADYPQVEVVDADFEQWVAPRHDYDAVVSFNAFHWIDPARRYQLTAGLLRPHGSLAFVEPRHVVPAGGDPFFHDMQEDYRAVGFAGDGAPGPPEDVPDFRDEIEASGFFDDLVVRRYLFTRGYTADEYIALMQTASDHRLLPDDVRVELFRRMRRRIGARPDGTVEMTHLAVLHVAHVALKGTQAQGTFR
jgi:SAM-dependent methyltransferase